MIILLVLIVIIMINKIMMEALEDMEVLVEEMVGGLEEEGVEIDES